MAATLLSGAKAAGAAETHKVGITAAVTGHAGDTYAPFYEGIRAYVTRVNERGSAGGRRIDFVVPDGKASW
jgi:ABC-type branched-subunit amino acid transport system substrate-binding protein